MAGGIKLAFSRFVTTLNVKVSTFFEVNKINTYKASISSEISSLKDEMADAVFIKWNAGEDFTEDVSAFCGAIKERNTLIKDLDTQKVEVVEMGRKILGKNDKPAKLIQDSQSEQKELMLVSFGRKMLGKKNEAEEQNKSDAPQLPENTEPQEPPQLPQSAEPQNGQVANDTPECPFCGGECCEKQGEILA